jgi:hypothetical protein
MINLNAGNTKVNIRTTEEGKAIFYIEGDCAVFVNGRDVYDYEKDCDMWKYVMPEIREFLAANGRNTCENHEWAMFYLSAEYKALDSIFISKTVPDKVFHAYFDIMEKFEAESPAEELRKIHYDMVMRLVRRHGVVVEEVLRPEITKDMMKVSFNLEVDNVSAFHSIVFLLEDYKIYVRTLGKLIKH